MKRGLLVFLAVCAFAVAMVPRNRRAVNTEEEEAPPKDTVRTCAPQTPCAWSIYDPRNKLIQINITNTYCICGEGTACLVIEDDTATKAFVHKCRDRSEGDFLS
uniref:Uncharacterized protein n=1 Tax=Heliothis virescens TaxID=7102 RepID=A0A2A4J1T6_HELVI